MLDALKASFPRSNGVCADRDTFTAGLLSDDVKKANDGLQLRDHIVNDKKSYFATATPPNT